MKYKDVLEIVKTSLLQEISRYKGKNIVIFGVNGYTEFAINLLYENGIYVKAILDNDIRKQGCKIFEIPIVFPEYVTEYTDVVVIIISNYYEEMTQQILDIDPSLTNQISVVYDFVQYNDINLQKSSYWRPDSYENEISILQDGSIIYDAIRNENTGLMVIAPTISIGDNFLWELSFTEYKFNNKINDYFIVVPSKGASKAICLYGENRVVIIKKQQMDELVKFVMFMGEASLKCMLIYPRYNNQRCFDSVFTYKGMGWNAMYKYGIFNLEKDIKFKYPSIKTSADIEAELIDCGLSKGKSIILSPYANTIKELPVWFWEILTKRLNELNYCVFTNVTGNQKAIKGTKAINIPLEKLGNYLEYAGCFVSLRNGLCDISGRAKCKQIVIYRDEMTLLLPKIIFNDLRLDDLSPYSHSIVWFDKDIEYNVNHVLELINVDIGCKR